ncbi:MAG: PPC domain-containing protein [Planctomycetota bacterium]|nr:PPC domain-containing protein [Planctomycetota bacterium]
MLRTLMLLTLLAAACGGGGAAPGMTPPAIPTIQELEPNDMQAQAQMIGAIDLTGRDQLRILGSMRLMPPDVDWLEFDAVQAQKWILSLDFAAEVSPGMPNDFDLSIFDDMLNVIGRLDSGAIPEMGEFTLPAPGTYFIVIVPPSGGGAYTLDLMAVAP